ncbi:MAG: hypothetical protein HFF70_08825 [Oscillospiraceae bacterium]|jgi:hypothetical protein|nr:hypothetical protein [Oscillospiraceae bacterium]
MKRNLLRNAGQAACLLLAVCLLGGCAALLERSYSAAEPYVDRYWDSGAEDTLRAESYQDLVNSLLLLIEERAEEGIIRCYGDVGEYREAMAAREEVRTETTLGAYLLRDLRISHESGSNYSTVTCYMTYREDAEDIDAIMKLSDSQSLVDLLRLSVREERDKLTARFSYDTPREDVIAAVESFWQELCRAEQEEAAAASAEILPEDVEDASGEDPGNPEEAGEAEEPEDAEPVEEESGEETEPPAEEPSQEWEVRSGAPGEGEPGEGEGPAEPPEEEFPPCPWRIQFYPNQETAEIVEVLLKT